MSLNPLMHSWISTYRTKKNCEGTTKRGRTVTMAVHLPSIPGMRDWKKSRRETLKLIKLFKIYSKSVTTLLVHLFPIDSVSDHTVESWKVKVVPECVVHLLVTTKDLRWWSWSKFRWFPRFLLVSVLVLNWTHTLKVAWTPVAVRTYRQDWFETTWNAASNWTLLWCMLKEIEPLAVVNIRSPGMKHHRCRYRRQNSKK